MSLPTTITPSKRRVRRKRRDVQVARTGLTIVNVTVGDLTFNLKVFFSAPIAWDGSTVPFAFSAFTNDGVMEGCIYVDAVGADWIEVEFNADVSVGAAWQLEAAMDGITPAVRWPQNGTVAS
ncbi:MAG TPA: hypothetical protein VHS31_03135 [Tepidisphaeraceae bacterium]|jgi:hypothetical protein|nr:hypothetical protein [Tepidisphaeraceae bacterium]